MKIYFFGGSFDPPHKAHKLIYKYCIDLCDKFLFIPAYHSPGKDNPIATKENRFKMLELLIDKEDYSKVSIDQFEFKSINKPNFTIDTIKYLEEKFMGASLYMVIGSDQYGNLINWKNYNEVINRVNIVCFNRKLNTISESFNTNIIDFDYDISSTVIKNKFQHNNIKDLEKELTKDVYDYIIKHKLYRN